MCIITFLALNEAWNIDQKYLKAKGEQRLRQFVNNFDQMIGFKHLKKDLVSD